MRNVFLTAAFGAMTALFLVAPLTAYDIRTGDEIYLSGDFDDDLFLLGGIVNFDGFVHGDIITAGNTITCNGTIDGNLLAAGERVTVSGEVRRSVRSFGRYVTVKSTVAGDLTAFAQEVHVTTDALLMRDCALFGYEIIVNGQIERNCHLYGETVTISGKIAGDVEIEAEEIRITPEAVIEGDLKYKSHCRADISPEAQIIGETKWKKVSRSSSTEFSFPLVLPPSSAIWNILLFCGSLIIGLVLVLFRPDMVGRVANDMKSNFIVHGLLGLMIIVVMPILLIPALIAFPLALVGFSIYVILFFIAKIFVAVTLGMVIIALIKREGRVSLGWSLILGLILLALLFKIPVAGWFIYLAAWAIGAGALTVCFFRRVKKAPDLAEPGETA